MCVMCSTSVPTLFQYFFYDHIPTFLYIFHEMFFITCSIYNQYRPEGRIRSVTLGDGRIGLLGATLIDGPAGGIGLVNTPTAELWRTLYSHTACCQVLLLLCQCHLQGVLCMYP